MNNTRTRNKQTRQEQEEKSLSRNEGPEISCEAKKITFRRRSEKERYQLSTIEAASKQKKEKRQIEGCEKKSTQCAVRQWESLQTNGAAKEQNEKKREVTER